MTARTPLPLRGKAPHPEVPALMVQVSIDTPDLAPVTVDSIIRLFEQIADEEGWQPGEQLHAHAERSTYFGLSDEGGCLIGGLQLVAPDPKGLLPCQSVWPELSIVFAERASEIAHIAVLAVAKEWRGKRGGAPFWLLCAAMWRHCVQHGIRELWLEVTPTMLRCYRLLGWPLVVRGELRKHWGEPCYPCSLSIREVAGTLAERAVRSPMYRRVLAQMVQHQAETS